MLLFGRGDSKVEYDKYAIGNRACGVREKKNLKQEDISKALGIHQATYSKFENGRYSLRTSQLIELCNILDVSVSWLIGEDSLPQLTDEERLDVENYIKFIISKRKL